VCLLDVAAAIRLRASLGVEIRDGRVEEKVLACCLTCISLLTLRGTFACFPPLLFALKDTDYTSRRPWTASWDAMMRRLVTDG